MIAFKGGADKPSDMLLPGKAGRAVTVRRILASTICRITDPTLVPRPRQLHDASTVMRFRSAHQSMINRRLFDRAPCLARQSLKAMLPRKPRIHSPASWKGGHESGAKLTFGTEAPTPRLLPRGSQWQRKWLSLRGAQRRSNLGAMSDGETYGSHH
jgi:hypothetical protein